MMARALGPRVPVRLLVGETEGEVGELAIPMKVTSGPAEGDAIPVEVSPDLPAFFASLAAMLQEVANEIEVIDVDDLDVEDDLL